MKNKPKFVVDSEGMYPVTNVEELNSGVALTYVKNGKGGYCYAGEGYLPYEFPDRLIFIKAIGNNSAGYLKIQGNTLFIEPCDINMPGEDWSSLLKAHWNINTIKAMSKSWMWLLWIAIPIMLIITLLIGFFVYKQINKQPKESEENATTGLVLPRNDQTARALSNWNEFRSRINAPDQQGQPIYNIKSSEINSCNVQLSERLERQL